MDYEAAKAALDNFRQTHQGIFDAYFQLVYDLNQKMEAADKVIRASGVSCSDWEMFSTQTKYDPDTFYNRVGQDNFLRWGGTLSTITKYGIDKKRFDAAVARNEIPEDIVREVRKDSPRYHSPDPLKP